MEHGPFTASQRRDALRGQLLFRTSDQDEARHSVTRVFSPHSLRIVGRKQLLDASMCHASLGNVSLNRLNYGATVDIEPAESRDFHLVMLPLAGAAEICCGRESTRTGPGCGAVITSSLPLKMRMYGEYDEVIVRLGRSLVERHCGQHLGRDITRPIEFRLELGLGAVRIDFWQRFVGLLLDELGRGGGALGSPMFRAHAESLLVGALLLSHPNNYSAELQRPAPSIAPFYVKRAEDYIEANADQPISPVDLAERVGCSTRALYAGFRNARGTSPMAYLKSVRLARVHGELLGAAPDSATVCETAMRWGFTHMGHFTAAYRRKFGESPSDTLRRLHIGASGRPS